MAAAHSIPIKLRDGKRLRHAFTLTTAAIILAFALCPLHAEESEFSPAGTLLKDLEEASGARLGVCALDTGTGLQIRYRADERFPLCSTFKVFVGSAILQRSVKNPGLLQQRIRYSLKDLATYSPVAEKHLDDGMTVAELCAAAIQYSDNTSANLLMKILGGPSAVTAFARSIGSSEFQIDRWEPEMNTAIPGDLRDTATPASIARGLKSLLLGDGLPDLQKEQLKEWLIGNTTGAKRIRAAAPAAWQVGDKTGSGDYGTANDIAVLWPPEGRPIILAIYQTHQQAEARRSDELIVAAARIVLKEFAASGKNPAEPIASEELQ